MELFWTEIWVLPTTPPEGGAFPYWDLAVLGESAPYDGETWDEGNKRYTQITIPPGELWTMRHRSDTNYLSDNPLDSYNYTFVVQGSPPALDMGFVRIYEGSPTHIVTARLDVTTYPYTRFPVAIPSTQCDYTLVSYTDEVPYNVSIFKEAPLDRRCLFVRPEGLIGNISAWKFLLYSPLKDMFPGLLPRQLS